MSAPLLVLNCVIAPGFLTFRLQLVGRRCDRFAEAENGRPLVLMLITPVHPHFDAGRNVLRHNTGVGLVLVLTARTLATGVPERDVATFDSHFISDHTRGKASIQAFNLITSLMVSPILR